MANKIEFKILGDARDLEKSLASTSGKLKNFGKGLTTFVSLPVLAAGTAFVKLASDAEETENKFNVVFNSIKKQAADWASSFGTSVGRSTQEIQKFSSGLGDVLKPLGFTTEEAFKLSSEMTQLALDVASFNNRQDADVVRAFTSALTGERESLKTLGIVINEADVKQEAYRSGIARVGQELTKTQKAQATINLLYANSKDAQGDLLRTQDSFANQLKRLQGSFQDLGVSLGKIILPAATEFVKKITSLLNKFNQLDVATQKNILAFSAFAAIIGPALVIVSALISSFGTLSASAAFLAANIGLIQAALVPLGAAGALAFASWNLGKVIGELQQVESLFNNIFGVDEAQKFLALEEQRNKLAVERAAAFRRENAEKINALEEQKILEAEAIANRIALEQEKTEFINNNEKELLEISKARSQEEINNLIEKFQLERDAQINHLQLKQQILDEADILSLEKKAQFEEQKKQITDKYNALEETARSATIKKISDFEKKGAEIAKKVNEDKLGSLQTTLQQAAQLNTKFAKAYKAVAIGEAIMSTAAGVANALRTAPFPVNLVNAALVGAAGAVQIATIAQQSFAVGTPAIPNDMVANVHKGEMIIPATFSDAIRSGDLSLSGSGGGGSNGATFDFTGATFNGVTEEFVKEIFTKAGENIQNRTLAPLPV